MENKWTDKSIVLSMVLLLNSSSMAFANDDKGWNSDLSKMMDGIEGQLGPPASGKLPPTPPPASNPALPPKEEIPQNLPAPVKIEKPVNKAAKAEINKFIQSLTAMKDNYLGSFAKQGLTRWPASSMPLKVYVELASQVKGFRTEFPEILKKAFDEWQSASEDKVKFIFIDSDKNAQIVCRWTDDKSELMSVKEGGNTVLVPDDDGILSVDMKILTLPPPGAQIASTNYMTRVCLHEVGHALGITGHSPQREDVMYPTVFPNDAAQLSMRDKNSMVELYKVDPSIVAGLKLDQAKALTQLQEEFDNPQVNAVRLNNDAAKAIKANKYDVAIKKLKRAHKLDPNNKLVCTNLGGIYANMGSIAGMTFNFEGAASFYKKAIPLLEKGNNKVALINVLNNYMRVLKFQKKDAEAKKIEAKLVKLK